MRQERLRRPYYGEEQGLSGLQGRIMSKYYGRELDVNIKVTPKGIYKASLMMIAWYAYGFGAACLVFLAWLEVKTVPKNNGGSQDHDPK